MNEGSIDDKLDRLDDVRKYLGLKRRPMIAKGFDTYFDIAESYPERTIKWKIHRTLDRVEEHYLNQMLGELKKPEDKNYNSSGGGWSD